MKTDPKYVFIAPGTEAEKQWKEKVQQHFPKAQVRTSGAGMLLAVHQGIPFHDERLGHFNQALGGFVLKKGKKP